MAERDMAARDGVLDREEFLRRLRYLCGHLEAVARMVHAGRETGEVLRQMRAARRSAEKLEVHCLMAHLVADGGAPEQRALRNVISLYRLANR